MLPKYKVRGFTTLEVAHRPNQTDNVLLPACCYLMGVLRCIRDSLCIELNKDIRIVVTSGNRPPDVNEATAGAAKNSNHQWAIRGIYQPKGVEFLMQAEDDFKVAADIFSPDISLEKLYATARRMVQGEIYVNFDENIVHVAPTGPVKPPFGKLNGKWIGLVEAELEFDRLDRLKKK